MISDLIHAKSNRSIATLHVRDDGGDGTNFIRGEKIHPPFTISTAHLGVILELNVKSRPLRPPTSSFDHTQICGRQLAALQLAESHALP